MGSGVRGGDTLQVSALLGPRPLGASTTYFRVSRLLQVEQEKQCTHQALLRADTTVRGRWGLSGRPPGQPEAQLCTRRASWARSCRTHSPESAGERGLGQEGGTGTGALPSPSITWLQV